jgi:hypothetical protein
VLRRQPVGARPAEAVFGACPGLIFAADKACIAEPVHRREYRRIIDFAFVGLGACRHGGDLRVTDHGKEFSETLDKIAADDLDMIKIELDAQVRRADLTDDVGGMLDVPEKIVRPVARIDRLDQHGDARLGRLRRGVR